MLATPRATRGAERAPPPPAAGGYIWPPMLGKQHAEVTRQLFTTSGSLIKFRIVGIYTL
jgi:hypothetical protein